jgi:hypothetical protein
MERRSFLKGVGAAAVGIPSAGQLRRLLRGRGEPATNAAKATTAPVAMAAVTVGGAVMRPPSVPLAVSTPYVSTWLPGTDLVGTWPEFWNGAQRGFAGLVRIDGELYTWAGAPVVAGILPAPMTQTSLVVTATRSTFTLEGGGVELVAEWLSPVEPGNPQLQSVPLTLLTITVTAMDGLGHDVQVYADVSGAWVANDPTRKIVWQTSVSTTSRYWSVQLAEQTAYGEDDDMATWGTLVWATERGPAETYQSGSDSSVRSEFAATGRLTCQSDPHFRANDNRQPVFGFASQLPLVSSSPTSISFAVGHARNTPVSYGNVTADADLSGLQALWTAYWPTWQVMTDAFLAGGPATRQRAAVLDAQVEQAATVAYGADYAALCVLALRQTYATTELVIGPQGQPWVFLKEISSGDWTNTVDMLYASAPLWLWLDPAYLAMSIQPVLDWCISPAYQDSPDWEQTALWTGTTSAGQTYPPVKEKYCPHSLGIYPNAPGLGPDNGEQMPVEESAGMLIMAAGWARTVAPETAATFLAPYQTLWSQWAAFLLTQVPAPSPQLSTDEWLGFTSEADWIVASVNLGVKAIIGLAAAAQIAELLDHEADATAWRAAATTAVGEWRSASMDPSGHYLNLGQGSAGTWGTLYNAAAELMIGTDLIPRAVADLQASWYQAQISGYAYGMPNQSDDPDNCKVGWLLLTAAWLARYDADYPVIADLIARPAAYLNNTPNLVPFSDRYNPATAASNGPKGHPIGAIFAPLLS